MRDLGNEIIDVYNRMQSCDTVREQRTIFFDSFDILGYGKKVKMWEWYIEPVRNERLGNLNILDNELLKGGEKLSAYHYNKYLKKVNSKINIHNNTVYMEDDYFSGRHNGR